MEITFKKQDEHCKTVEDVIEKNSGVPIKEIVSPEAFPYIPGIKECISMMHDFRARKKTIRVIGDYDTDGETSSTIADEAFSEFLGYPVSVRLPRRFSEGYGIKMAMVEETTEDVIITVDNGISAVDEIKAAKAMGKTVIIIDHHLMREDGLLPPADLIIDPHITGGYEEYCAAGLMYRIALELCPNSPNIPHWTALAAAGTVADMMRLVGDNRRIVREGLEYMNAKQVGTGFAALLSVMCGEVIREDDLGFGIGPVCNASGRLRDNGAEAVHKILRTHLNPASPSFITQYMALKKEVMDLKAVNEERKALVDRDDKIVDDMVERGHMTKRKAIVICLDGADERQAGWVGILAGHIVEKYNRLAIVFTKASGKPGIIKGSGRTCKNVHLKHVLDKCADLLLGFGGHSGAAGLTMEEKNLKEFRERINAILDDMDEGTDTTSTNVVRYYDLDITEDDIPSMLQKVQMYGPYGQGCPNIIFRTTFHLLPIKSDYFRTLGTRGSVKFQGRGFEAVGFHLLDRYNMLGRPRTLDVIFTLDENIFRGESTPQMRIEEMLSAERPPERTEFSDMLSQALINHKSLSIESMTGHQTAAGSSVTATGGPEAPAPAPRQREANDDFLSELANLLKI